MICAQQEAQKKLRPMPLDLNPSVGGENTQANASEEYADHQYDERESSPASSSEAGRSDIRRPLQEQNGDFADRQSISFEAAVDAQEASDTSTKEDASSAVSHFAFPQAPALRASSAEHLQSAETPAGHGSLTAKERMPVKESSNSPAWYSASYQTCYEKGRVYIAEEHPPRIWHSKLCNNLVVEASSKDNLYKQLRDLLHTGPLEAIFLRLKACQFNLSETNSRQALP